jgi:hypothetical protein
MSFDKEIFDSEIFDTDTGEAAHKWGYVIPSKLQKRFLATGRISRHETLILHGKGLLTRLAEQGVNAMGQTCLRRQYLRKAVGKKGFGLVLEALGLLELTYSFMYVAVVDDRTCDLCLKYDKKVMTGDDAERTFPYLTKGPGDSIWLPNNHNFCRCMLVLLEVGI